MGTFSPWYRLILVQRRSTKFFLESPLLTAVFFFSRWGSGHGGPSFELTIYKNRLSCVRSMLPVQSSPLDYIR
jgi:hypothetical protein